MQTNNKIKYIKNIKNISKRYYIQIKENVDCCCQDNNIFSNKRVFSKFLYIVFGKKKLIYFLIILFQRVFSSAIYFPIMFLSL